MTIAFTIAPSRGETDSLLGSFANLLMQEGFNPVGTVQINTGCEVPGRCDMDVNVLPEGPVIRISQSLGAGAKGCRLDPGALETAVALVDQSLGSGADCLIVNKFGKHEAAGGGFRPLIAKAMEREIPTIIGLSRLNGHEFQEFTMGLATQIEPRLDDLRAWFNDCMDLRSGSKDTRSASPRPEVKI